MCPPEQDCNYFGSYKDKTFKPKEKIILFKFNTRKEAEEAEVKLHAFFQVHINKHFANKSRQLTHKFSTAGCVGHWKGKKQSDAHKENHAKAIRGRKHSAETKNKIGLKSKGNRHRLNHKLTEDQKNYLRDINKGRSHSPETIEKIRQSKIGKKLSQEVIEKIRKSRKGKKMSAEQKQKISNKLKQVLKEKENRYSVKRTLSPETKRKISEGVKNAHKKKKRSHE